MRPRDFFTVGFRLLGVWMLLEALGELVSGAELQLRLIEPLRTAPLAYFFHAAIDAIVAVALLRSDIKLFWPDPDPDSAGFEVLPTKDVPSPQSDAKKQEQSGQHLR